MAPRKPNEREHQALRREVARLTERLADMEERLAATRGELPAEVESLESELRAKNEQLHAADAAAIELQLLAGEFEAIWKGAITDSPVPDHAAEMLRGSEAAWRAYRDLRDAGVEHG